MCSKTPNHLISTLLTLFPLSFQGVIEATGAVYLYPVGIQKTWTKMLCIKRAYKVTHIITKKSNDEVERRGK